MLHAFTAAALTAAALTLYGLFGADPPERPAPAVAVVVAEAR